MPLTDSESTRADQADHLRRSVTLLRDELDFVYALDEKMAAEAHGQAKLSRLLGELTRRLNMSYSVLLIPSKNIRISVSHANWKSVDRRIVDGILLQRLFPKYSDSREPTLLQIPEVPKSVRGPQEPYQLIFNIVRNHADEPVGILASFCQVEARPLSTTASRQLSFITRYANRVIDDSYDALTGLMLRLDFEALVDAACSDLQSDQDGHCLVYFDVDQLQVFNDSLDQRAGDEVLMRVANLLQSEMPSGASLARIGGDKFAVLMRYRDIDAGVDFAEQVRSQSHNLVYLRGEKAFPITLSAGVVALGGSDIGDDSPLVVARITCQKAKDHGGDRVVCYDETDKSIVRRVDNLQLFAQLQDAITNKSFSLDAQPIVPIDGTSEGGHFEILLRMNGPGGDVMLPHQFFSAAEHYQMMPKLDRFVLQRFFATVEELSDTMALHQASFALNLSGQSLGEPAFHEYVRQMVLGSSLSPDQLCFEITETAAIANRENAVRFMHAMRELGCRFALDDFGAGLSSFAYLRDMPVDILKIDGSFVQDMDTNKVSESMVAAAAQVAKVMGLKTVAEFVETESVRAGLERLGVDYGQGFLLGRPLPLEEQLDALAGVSPDTNILNLRHLIAVSG